MRELSETLMATQRQASRTPYVKLTASNRIAGVTRLDWTRLYQGSEDNYFHAVTMPGDGSLLRVRITPPADCRKLYRQRVVDPDAESDFSQWDYTGQYNAVIVAAAALGAEVSIFWVKSDRKIQRLKSSDNGTSWDSPELVDYSPTTAINGIAAAYRPDGDLALFFADQATLYVKKCQGGQWQTKSAWDKTTGTLSGVAAVYDGDWNLFVTGQDTDGNYRLWSLAYGDGGDVAAGVWSELKEFARAPSGGQFEYHRAFLDKPDVCRGCHVEKFTGQQAYCRPFWSHQVAGSAFGDHRWREPVPFDLSSEYGLAMAHHGGYCWLSCPDGVWRAPLAPQEMDLTADILALKQESDTTDGQLTVELDNSDGVFSGLPSPLGIGCQLDFSPGYHTSQGKEYSPGLSFVIEAYEHTSAASHASLVLYAGDGWSRLAGWQARYQMRWNKDTADTCIKNILALVLARAGLQLEVISQSTLSATYCPEFSINPGGDGKTAVARLLSFVPDVVFIEGQTAYLVNPLAADEPVYSYTCPQYETDSHPIIEGRYHISALEYNRIQVEGYDEITEEAVVAESFAWDEVNQVYDRLRRIEDNNIEDVAGAQARGQACLRRAEIAAADGLIKVPVNCGQQLYDVIAISDGRAGLESCCKRLLGITIDYNPGRGQYQQRLLLGAV